MPKFRVGDRVRVLSQEEVIKKYLEDGTLNIDQAERARGRHDDHVRLQARNLGPELERPREPDPLCLVARQGRCQVALPGVRSVLRTEQLGAFYTGLELADEISADLERSYPMLRLLQGDVGSGKTVVAALAIQLVVAAGSQAVLMVPTEILAEQHAATLADWFEPQAIGVTQLTGMQSAAEKRSALAAMAEGSARIIVGTHALLEETVQFADLGLAEFGRKEIRLAEHEMQAVVAQGLSGWVWTAAGVRSQVAA